MEDIKIKHLKGFIRSESMKSDGWLDHWTRIAEDSESRGNTIIALEVPEGVHWEVARAVEIFLQSKNL